MTLSVKPVAFTIAALLLVAALWHFFRPHERQAAGAAPGPAATDPARAADVFELVLEDGRLASGQSVLQVHQGERVVLRIRSNTTDELHLHGYDLHARITPQETTLLEFRANRTGRFTLELHNAQTELGALEVYPQ